ncbi:hypothetical protein AFLA_013861 [Aspergillus flavus NRRL3357]|nr:hypothetical protein AFLA_013861 [Aspergillus flavus NRRL3357]
MNFPSASARYVLFSSHTPGLTITPHPQILILFFVYFHWIEYRRTNGCNRRDALNLSDPPPFPLPTAITVMPCHPTYRANTDMLNCAI